MSVVRTTSRSLSTTTLLILVFAPAIACQTSVELGPLLGYYLPTAHYDPATVYLVSLPTKPQDLKGGAWGGEARIWLGTRLGVEVQVATSSTELGPVYTPGGPAGPTVARIAAGSAQLLYTILADSRGARIWVGGGPGAIRHGGDAYAEVGSQTDIAGDIGLGGRVPLGGAVGLAAGVTAMFYSYDVPMPPTLSLNGESLQRGSQRDALFYASLTWTFP